MAVLYASNVSTAASPQAIRANPPPKPPLWSNDPTRNVSRREAIDRVLLVAFAVAAVLVMLVSTVWVVSPR
jgi:hypothetical protein